MVREPCDRAVITANQNVIATVVRGEVLECVAQYD